jgi:uncharacterized protein DUF892
VIIAAAQKCEHYEIASYGTIRVWANLLDHTDVASIFEDTLEEEKSADVKLTEVAESFVNEAAAEDGDNEDNDEEETKETKSVASRSRRTVVADRKTRR